MTFNNSENIYRLAIEILHLHIKAEEYVYALCFDTALQSLQGVFEISHSSIDCFILSPREVLLRAFLCRTNRLLILHNHPSGNPKPSREDIAITNRMQKACELIGIPLIAHIIIGNGCYYSFQKEHFL